MAASGSVAKIILVGADELSCDASASCSFDSVVDWVSAMEIVCGSSVKTVRKWETRPWLAQRSSEQRPMKLRPRSPPTGAPSWL